MKARALWLSVASLVACAQPSAPPRDLDLAVPDAVEIDDYPQTPEALYAEFAPMPEGAVAVDYAVSGPGGMKGTMTVTAAEGARRAEVWSLTMPMPGASPVRIEGAAVHTPALAWTDAAEGAAELISPPLGRVGAGFFALDTATQHSIIDHVRTWHAEVELGRREHPGAIDAVAGKPCLRTRTAGQSLCVWESTGLPLDYRSEAFVLEATEVREGVAVDETTFQIPGGGQQKADVSQTFDPAQSLEKLAAGDLAELPVLVQPRLFIAG